MRAMRRRITIPEAFDADSFKAVVKQLNDHQEYIESLQNKLDLANDRLLQQDKSMTNWRKWHEDNAKRLDQAEARVQQGTVESKEHTVTKLKDFEIQVVNEMVKREAPIYAMLNSINGLLNVTGGQTEKQQVYLQSLHEVRPQEGQTVMSAFKWMDDKIREVEQFVQSAHVAAGPTPTNTTDPKETDKKLNLYGDALECLRLETQSSLENIKNDIAIIRMSTTVPSAAPAAQADAPPPPPPSADGRRPRWPTRPPAPNLCGTGGCKDPTCGTPGPGSTSDDRPYYLTSQFGGNNVCHCVHVVKLMEEMKDVHLELAKMRTTRTPLIPPSHTPHGGPAPDPTAGGVPGPSLDPAGSISLPLQLGPLGALTTNRIFDDKISTSSEFKFNGHSGGDDWKNKVQRYMISKIPALSTIFTWAEREDQKIDMKRLAVAIGDGLTVTDNHGFETDYTQQLDSAIWGFLSNCISGEADTMFKQAETCAGIDAWRRIVRLIDHGRTARLEQLRNEVRMIRTHPIKKLEHVTVGIAEFENKINEYVKAGGRPVPQEEMKSDLNAILPQEVSEHLMLRVTDKEHSYQAFRDFVIAQVTQLLMSRRRLPVNAVDEPQRRDDDGGSPEEDGDFDGSINNVNDLFAVLNRMMGKGRPGPRGQDTKGGRREAAKPRDLSGRKCPNCGEVHPMSECKKPIIDKADRKCWNCGKAGHQGRECPERKSLKNVNDQQRALLQREP